MNRRLKNAGFNGGADRGELWPFDEASLKSRVHNSGPTPRGFLKDCAAALEQWMQSDQNSLIELDGEPVEEEGTIEDELRQAWDQGLNHIREEVGCTPDTTPEERLHRSIFEVLRLVHQTEDWRIHGARPVNIKRDAIPQGNAADKRYSCSVEIANGNDRHHVVVAVCKLANSHKFRWYLETLKNVLDGAVDRVVLVYHKSEIEMGRATRDLFDRLRRQGRLVFFPIRENIDTCYRLKCFLRLYDKAVAEALLLGSHAITHEDYLHQITSLRVLKDLPLLDHIFAGFQERQDCVVVSETAEPKRDVLEVVASKLEPARKIGQEVGPGYEWQLERLLGIGSFGEVWMCGNLRDHDPDHAGRNCRAFKFFSSVKGANWIEREANSLFEIQDKLPDGHPNIVKFYSVAVAEQPYPLLEFEYVSDGSLEDWIVADQRMRQTLDVTQIVRDVVEGLAAAHEAGIFHRHVKPANILLTAGPNPSAKVTDFGLGTIPNRPLGTATARSLGATTGTQLYLPPAAAEPFAAIEPAQQDVFAVGVVWPQLCVTRLERPPYNFAQQLITSGAESHSIELISTCLAHPEARFSSAAALRERLVDIVPPAWDVPEDRYDVRHIFREYLAATS